MNNLNPNFDDLLDKIKDYAQTAGIAAARIPLNLYYIMMSSNTSMTNKAIIGAALGYQFFPKQILTREKNGVWGIADNIVALGIAYNRMKACITPEITAQVDAKLQEWSGKFK